MMRPLAFLCVAAVLAGCSRPQDRAVEEGSARDTSAAVATPAAATISLADIAGKWKIRSTDEAGGNPLEVELLATANTSGWTLTGPKRKPIPVRVIEVAGDSIVTEAGPYESFLRKGVQVRTRSVARLQDGKLIGTVEARFTVGGRDSVAHRRTEGTRVP